MTIQNEMVAGVRAEDWQAWGACRGLDPGIFFPGPEDDYEEALAVCRTCRVREECLQYALENRERFGIWGGTTERQRRRLMRRSA